MVQSIVSDAVAADVLFTVRGQCVGDGVDYTLITANVGDSGRELLSGTLECGVEDDLPAQSSAYEGLVQVMLGSTDDVDAAWVAVVPAS